MIEIKCEVCAKILSLELKVGLLTKNCKILDVSELMFAGVCDCGRSFTMHTDINKIKFSMEIKRE